MSNIDDNRILERFCTANARKYGENGMDALGEWRANRHTDLTMKYY